VRSTVHLRSRTWQQRADNIASSYCALLMKRARMRGKILSGPKTIARDNMLTLYDFGNSVCCQKVRITMHAKGLDWTSVKVDLFKAEQYRPDYLKLNPKGIVPTLVHDGKAVIESTLICEYLDDTFPEPHLKPADAWLRTRMRLWSKMVDEGLFEGITGISFSAIFRERMHNMLEEIRETRFRKIGDPRRRDRFMSTYELGVRSPF